MQVFPVASPHRYTRDFGNPRRGPPVHTHQGTDIFAAKGTLVYAVADGVVTYSDGGLGGIGINLKTADGTRYYYAHLDSRSVANGATVKAGDVIGAVGDTGNAQGGPPHLHFEVHPQGGAAVDPYDDLRAAEGMAPTPKPPLKLPAVAAKDAGAAVLVVVILGASTAAALLIRRRRRA